MPLTEKAATAFMTVAIAVACLCRVVAFAVN